MNRRFVLGIIGIFLFMFVFQGRCGEKTQKLQLLHREIGNNLIRIKKKHPQAQSLVYSLLDQFGKYYAYSMEILSKKKEYKQLLQAELTTNESLSQEKSSMNEKMVKMKKAILSVHKRMESDSARTNQLEEEKSALEREREDFLREKEDFEMERNNLVSQRDMLLAERDALIRERQEQPASQPAVQPLAEPSSQQGKQAQPTGGFNPQPAHAEVYARANVKENRGIKQRLQKKMAPSIA